MARMNWERAAQQDRVRIAGAERAERQIISRRPRDHQWSPWTQARKPDARWRRQCAKCKKVEFRTEQPARSEPEISEPRVRVARTKGDLVIRRVDGIVRVVPAKDAARQAREALTTAAQRDAARELIAAPGSVRKAVVKKKVSAQRFKKTAGESSIDRVFRGVPVTKAAKPVARPTKKGGSKKQVVQPPPRRSTPGSRFGRPEAHRAGNADE